jgi:hypothetical protein
VQPDGYPDPAVVRGCVQAAKRHLVPESGSLIVGLGHEGLVALYPLEEPGGLDRLKEQCRGVRDTLTETGAAIGIGGWHVESMSKSYREAKQALHLATQADEAQRVQAYDDLVLHQFLRADPAAREALAAVLDAVEEYDDIRQAGLMATLAAYFAAGFNLTRAASLLFVQPNTVVYRLRRIRELTGRDPSDPEDLFKLILAWKIRQTVFAEPANPHAESDRRIPLEAS